MFAARFFVSQMPLLLATIVCLLPQSAQAQLQATPSKPQPKQAAVDSDGYVLTTYDVADLVLNVPDYPYPGPCNLGHNTSRAMGGIGGMGGGMMGGGMFNIQTPGPLHQFGGGVGGGVGGGYSAGSAGMATLVSAMCIPTSPSTSGRITIEELQEVILTIVAPNTWSQVGGDCDLAALGNSLVVRQTTAVHRQIQELLKQLREGTRSKKTVSIDARWLLLSSDDLDRLISTEEDGCPRVDRKMLAEYTRRPSSIRAITNCFTGQLVYLVSGTRRNVISGYIPVVGSADSPQDRALHLASMAGGPFITNAQNVSRSVGYQPLVEKTNLGTLLEIRATLVLDENRAIVDLRSTITLPAVWRTDAAVLAEQIAQQPLAPVVDRIATEKQELATTLSMPLRQPVLAGGITFSAPSEQSPQAPDAAEALQLYLVLEVR